MIQKLKTRLARKLLGQQTEQAIEVRLKATIKELIGDHETPDYIEIRKTVNRMLFDALYEDSHPEPSATLTKYYEAAAQGKGRFLKDPFYIMLKTIGDPAVKKLKYRLKRAREGTMRR